MKIMLKVVFLLATLLLVAGVAFADWCRCYEAILLMWKLLLCSTLFRQDLFDYGADSGTVTVVICHKASFVLNSMKKQAVGSGSDCSHIIDFMEMIIM